MTKEECVKLIEEVYDEFSPHTLGYLTSADKAEVDILMSDLVHLLGE